MRKLKITTRLLAMLLVLTAAVIPTIVNASATEKVYDYSKEGSYFNESMNTADIVEMILGTDLGDAEYNYLEAYGELGLSYEKVTNSGVSVSATGNELDVRALTYTYTAVNGSSVTWIPKYATIDDVTHDFVQIGGEYHATFGVDSVDHDATVQVAYQLNVDFVFSKDDVNRALNMAYDNAPGVKSRYEAAESKYNEYCTFVAQNSAQINKYKNDCDLYTKYLYDLMIYEGKKEVHDEYLLEYRAYEEEYARYEDYLTKLSEYNYIKDYNENFDTKVSEYDIYLANLDAIGKQIDTFDSALYDEVTDLERQIYSSILSSVVDQVVERKNEFVSYFKIDPKVIDDSANATVALRSLLRDYNKLTTTEAKYNYYAKNYVAIRDNTVTLARALENLYSNKAMRLALYREDREVSRKLAIFVAQLILFANVVSDTTIYDYKNKYVLNKSTTMEYYEGEYISKKGTPVQILGSEYVKDTGKATPVLTAYPAYLEEPAIKELPPLPDPVERPAAPDFVEEPTAPAVVAPAVAPEGYLELILTEEEENILANELYVALVSAYDNGELSARAGIDADYVFAPTEVVSKRISSTDFVTVDFCDTDGSVIASVTVDKGEAVNFNGTLPTKADDVIATYSFLAWVDSNGQSYNLSSVNENVSLYPSFNTNYKKFDIDSTSSVIVDLGDTFRTDIPFGYIANLGYVKNNTITFRMPDVDVIVPVYGVETLKENGVTTLDFHIESDEIGAYTCKVSAKNDQNEKVDTDVTFTMYISCTDQAFGSNCKLYSVNDGQIVKEHIKTYNKDRGLIFFKVNLNVDYLLDVRYDLGVDKTIADGVVEIAESARPGETVTVNILQEIPVGQVAVIYYTIGTGPKVYIEDNSFIMPYGNIIIGFTVEDVIYTVEFISDGEVISTKTYTYGLVLEIPENPTKDSDGINTYTFVGWAPEINDIVNSDAIYVAVFEATPIPKEAPKENTDENESKDESDNSNVGIIILIVAGVLVGGGVGAYFALRKQEFFIRFMETKVLPLFVKKSMAVDDEIAADTDGAEQGAEDEESGQVLDVSVEPTTDTSDNETET